MEDIYNSKASEYVAQYMKLEPAQVHASWSSCLPDTSCRVLDVGTGSGRDAHWLAQMGHEVTAMDPAKEMLALAIKHYGVESPGIDWRVDKLPELNTFKEEKAEYQLILVSAVWMHLTPDQQKRSLRKLTNLLRPGGIIVITLREGPSLDQRVMHRVCAEELKGLARGNALEILHQTSAADSMGRPEATWHTLVLRLPDDGTGALPLLRHIIVNDNKTATYKLVLLKVLVRIANNAAGAARRVNPGQVTVPFGLVALYWVKLLYRPVLERGMLQLPKGKELKNQQHLRALPGHDIHFDDLKTGQRFDGHRAKALVDALREARNLIAKMPANYITFPGMSTRDPVAPQIFLTTSQAYSPRKGPLLLDEVFLFSLGTFNIPMHIWDAMTRYACWIEPAIDHEWIILMQTFNKTEPKSLDEYNEAIEWLDIRRAQQRLRPILNRVLEKKPVHCVWSGRRISKSTEENAAIDHLFPFAHWPNNDLWNLFPANPTVNGSKLAKLVTSAQLQKSAERILTWWDDVLSVQQEESGSSPFFPEANTSLPHPAQLSSFDSFHQVFSAIDRQRVRLKTYQQLPEWEYNGK
ncbi:class I SAM-dependent methyltransferase [Myxococcota bacterium]|nr:class I SAM-dependent methyltransferase [Myxococcota bacterium]